jgi:hypothetical protein
VKSAGSEMTKERNALATMYIEESASKGTCIVIWECPRALLCVKSRRAIIV